MGRGEERCRAVMPVGEVGGKTPWRDCGNEENEGRRRMRKMEEGEMEEKEDGNDEENEDDDEKEEEEEEEKEDRWCVGVRGGSGQRG